VADLRGIEEVEVGVDGAPEVREEGTSQRRKMRGGVDRRRGRSTRGRKNVGRKEEGSRIPSIM
jgi:hypothetical protein